MKWIFLILILAACSKSQDTPKKLIRYGVGGSPVDSPLYIKYIDEYGDSNSITSYSAKGFHIEFSQLPGKTLFLGARSGDSGTVYLSISQDGIYSDNTQGKGFQSLTSKVK